MTKLEFLNKFFFQWFFIRLTFCQTRIITEMKLSEISLLTDGNYGIGGQVKNYKIKYWYSLQGWVLPLSGWEDDYRTIGKRWYLRVTKKRINNK